MNSQGFARPEIRLEVFFVDDLTAHPTDDDLFFAATAAGLFRSRDIGESWDLVISDPGQPGIPVSGIVFSPLNANLGLVETGGWHEPDEGSGIYRTTDAWTTLPKSMQAVFRRRLRSHRSYSTLTMGPCRHPRHWASIGPRTTTIHLQSCHLDSAMIRTSG